MSEEPAEGPSEELIFYVTELSQATAEELAGPLKEFAEAFIQEFEKNALDKNFSMAHKQCAGCGALLPMRKPMCPHCHSYRFDLPL
jgi:hypothetical protein